MRRAAGPDGHSWAIAAGGSVSGMGACHLDDLPGGYHTDDRGRSLGTSGAVASRAAHGRPRGGDCVHYRRDAVNRFELPEQIRSARHTIVRHGLGHGGTNEKVNQHAAVLDGTIRASASAFGTKKSPPPKLQVSAVDERGVMGQLPPRTQGQVPAQAFLRASRVRGTSRIAGVRSDLYHPDDPTVTAARRRCPLRRGRHHPPRARHPLAGTAPRCLVHSFAILCLNHVLHRPSATTRKPPGAASTRSFRARIGRPYRRPRRHRRQTRSNWRPLRPPAAHASQPGDRDWRHTSEARRATQVGRPALCR
jgi:hypothetical protein